MTDGTDEQSLMLIEKMARDEGRPEVYGDDTLAMVAEIRRLRELVDASNDKLSSLESINSDVERALRDAMTVLFDTGHRGSQPLRLAEEIYNSDDEVDIAELWRRADRLLMGSDGNGGNMPVLR